MAQDIQFKNRLARMDADFGRDTASLKAAKIVEGLSQLTETTVEFVTSKHELDLQNVLGTQVAIHLDKGEGDERRFVGTCVSAEYLGSHLGMGHYIAELRPWLWFLTRTRENRIFQEVTSIDVIQSILQDYGFSSSLTNRVNDTLRKRTYCVQYDETDFDFISRLMAEDGIYYFFDYDGASGSRPEKLVLTSGRHDPIAGESKIKFHYRDDDYRRNTDHIFEWNERSQITTGKVTLNDYDFNKPKADQKSVKTIATGKHKYKSYEHYRYSGHSLNKPEMDQQALVRMQAEAVQHKLLNGVGNVRTFAAGARFTLKGHPRKAYNDEYLLARVVHTIQVENDYEDSSEQSDLAQQFTSRFKINPENQDTYLCEFEVIPSSTQFRAPHDIEAPTISGLQTAVVTGPSGQEIHTDKFGRIKIQFHWDRLGKKDDKSTCWVRCVMPWTGKNWGMISIPRVGSEVAIQFEEGNPDRPICTGMLYNQDNMPPFALPGNATQTGIVTRSSKDGTTKNFNQLVFEDKKGSEFVNLQSERDYLQTIKNNSVVNIGLETKKDGDLTQTIHRNKTETLNTGDHTLTVKDGNKNVWVKKDHSEIVQGKSTQTLTGNFAQTIKEGNVTQDLNRGHFTQTIDMGNLIQTAKKGNVTVAAKLGKVEISAMQSITLKVGGSKIVVDQKGVEISGPMIKVKANAMVEASAPMTTVKGNAMLTLQGALTKIN